MAQRFYIGDWPRAAVPTEEVDCGAELAASSLHWRRQLPKAKLSDEPQGSTVKATIEAPPNVEEADKAGGDPHVSEPKADKSEALPYSPRQVQAATDPGGWADEAQASAREETSRLSWAELHEEEYADIPAAAEVFTMDVNDGEDDHDSPAASEIEPSSNGDDDSGPREASPSTVVAEPISGAQADVNADDARDSQSLTSRTARRRRRRKAKVAEASAASSSASGRCDPLEDAEPPQRLMKDSDAALLMMAALDFAKKGDHEQALVAFARLMHSDVRAQLPIEQLYQAENVRVKFGWQTILHYPLGEVTGGVRGSVQAAHRAALADSMAHVVKAVHYIATTAARRAREQEAPGCTDFSCGSGQTTVNTRLA